MRSIAPGLRTYVAARTYISTACSTRIFGPAADEGAALPLVTIHRQSSDAHDCLDAHDDSLIDERFTILPWADDDETALSLSEQLAQEMDNFTGAMGSHRVAKAVYIEDESGEFDPEEYGGPLGRFVHPVSVLIQHSPA